MRIVFEDEVRRKRRLRSLALGAIVMVLLGLVIWAIASLTTDVRADNRQQGAGPADVRDDAEFVAEPERTSTADHVQHSPNAPERIDCDATDGDTLNCGGRRIRLIGIDAPELPGHCRQGRECVDGDPFAATQALDRLIGSGDLQIVVLGQDHYGRELANVYSDGRNVACDLIDDGHAIYVAEWDERQSVNEDCRVQVY